MVLWGTAFQETTFMERVPVRGNEGTPPFLFTLVKVKGERISLPTKWKDERRFLIIYSDVLLEFSRRSLFFFVQGECTHIKCLL